jgi:hypothetical protein
MLLVIANIDNGFSDLQATSVMNEPAVAPAAPKQAMVERVG